MPVRRSLGVTLILGALAVDAVAAAIATLHAPTGERLLAWVDESRRNYVRNKVGYTDIGGTTPVQ